MDSYNFLISGKLVSINSEDFDRINEHRWWYDKSNGYVHTRINGKKVYMHRFIIGNNTKQRTDHINRNKLDNRKENLRIVSTSLNNYNRETTAKYRGLYFDKYGSRWRACLSVKNKTLKLGSFKKIKDAMKAYNKKAFEIYGDDAFQHVIA
ncbi:hypothetical protein LCGC14_2827010 [marine sediment metagenome]|uniref:AP2/ERF domain-containing protein n=1 Tax=marine sediment metagenome TaxID=412755 RepID=A0A0F9B6D0_9ZZZZ